MHITYFYYADGLLKNNSTSTGFQPYLYSGKELVKMHGYDCYDYGARHSQAALGRFTSPDPLAEKYYGTSPYALCNGNPVRYVDPDGRWPWENDNIQRARNDASNIGGSVNLVQGEYGIDAQILNNRGEVVNTRYATAGNQKTPLRNFVETLDKGGHSHARGTTDITTQDVAVATGVIGVITGGMSLLGGTLIVGGISAAEGSASVAGILNSLDDIGTNAKGESLLQQSVGSDIGKQVVTATKTAISITNVITDILNNRNLLGAMDGINNIVSIVISNTNENK